MMECLYYTDGLISDRKTLTKLCLLFDKISTFYLSPLYFLEPLEERWQSEKDMPFFSKSPCEKELLTSCHLIAHKKFLAKNRELIESDVLKPIVINQTPPDWESLESNEKRLMKDGTGITIGLWGQSVGIVPKEKIYVDAPWYSLYRWHSIAGALHFALQTQQIPISDKPALSQLGVETVRRLSDIEHLPTMKEIAANVAFQSISLLIPSFPALEAAEILEARDKLSEDLAYFRTEMEKISREIDEISYKEIESIVLQRIKPRFDDLKLRLKSLRGELFRKISRVFFVGGTATTLLSHFLTLPITAQIAASTSFIGKILLDIHENLSKRDLLRKDGKNRGLVLLLKMEKLRS